MNQDTAPIIDFIERLARGIITHPNEFKIVPVQTTQKTIIAIDSHAADYPKLIGGSGRMINGIKTLVKFAGNKMHQQIAVELNQPLIGEREAVSEYIFNPKYDFETMTALVHDACKLVLDCDQFEIELKRAGQLAVVEVMVFGNKNGSIFGNVDPNLALALDSVFWVYGKFTGHKINITLQNVASASIP